MTSALLLDTTAAPRRTERRVEREFDAPTPHATDTHP